MSRPARVLVDCSHEFLFNLPFRNFLEQCGYEVRDTQVGLRPDVVFAFDACVMWNGSLGYSDEELGTLLQFVERGGGVLIAGDGVHACTVATFLGLPEAPHCFDEALLFAEPLQLAALPSTDASTQDPAVLQHLFERLTAARAGDSELFNKLGEVRQCQLELDFCSIFYPDSLAGDRVNALGNVAEQTYNAVAEQFGYRNTEQKMQIVALLCCGSGWQASKYRVGIGCLGDQRAVQSVMIHEFSNSLCVELCAMGGDAGWSTYVQHKVKRSLGWENHQQSTEEVHQESLATYKTYESTYGVVDPSDEHAYSHGANEAIIAKWKTIYTHFEMTYATNIMHLYFEHAKRCAHFLQADGWNRLHDRMIVYFSLATGEDQTAYFESMGYVPTLRWSDEVRKMRECPTFTPWGCSGNNKPSCVPVEHPLASTSWMEGLLFDNGYQTYCLKEDGSYLLVAAGAAGNCSGGGVAGKGAILKARARFKAGVHLRVLVGQRATSSNQGGGGATIVWADGEVLMVAGGGGIHDAQLDENGGDAFQEDGSLIPESGGRAGQGGRSFTGQGGQGGAGWLSGAQGDQEGPEALSCPQLGGNGGHRWDGQFALDKYGGFGGGGAEWYGSAGGGGYSGGAGSPCYGQSGGGGSWIAGHLEDVGRESTNAGAGFLRIHTLDLS